jgi:hypothetical protein
MFDVKTGGREESRDQNGEPLGMTQCGSKPRISHSPPSNSRTPTLLVIANPTILMQAAADTT